MNATWNQDAICFVRLHSRIRAATEVMQNRLCFNGAPDEKEVAIDFFADASDEYVSSSIQVGQHDARSLRRRPTLRQVLMTASTQDFQSQVQYENTQLSQLSDPKPRWR